MPLIPMLGRQRQVDLSEFRVSLSARTAMATQKTAVLGKKKQISNNKQPK